MAEPGTSSAVFHDGACWRRELSRLRNAALTFVAAPATLEPTGVENTTVSPIRIVGIATAVRRTRRQVETLISPLNVAAAGRQCRVFTRNESGMSFWRGIPEKEFV
jgi:hypothetical protein